MLSSRMLRRVFLVRTDFSEECTASVMKVTEICELKTMLALIGNRRTLRRYILYLRSVRRLLVTANVYLTDSGNSVDEEATFLRYVGSYKSHTA
jgi:hypothetical protein